MSNTLISDQGRYTEIREKTVQGQNPGQLSRDRQKSITKHSQSEGTGKQTKTGTGTKQ